jgi:hypothetical protein
MKQLLLLLLLLLLPQRWCQEQHRLMAELVDGASLV